MGNQVEKAFKDKIIRDSNQINGDSIPTAQEQHQQVEQFQESKEHQKYRLLKQELENIKQNKDLLEYVENSGEDKERVEMVEMVEKEKKNLNEDKNIINLEEDEEIKDNKKDVNVVQVDTEEEREEDVDGKEKEKEFSQKQIQNQQMNILVQEEKEPQSNQQQQSQAVLEQTKQSQENHKKEVDLEQKLLHQQPSQKPQNEQQLLTEQLNTFQNLIIDQSKDSITCRSVNENEENEEEYIFQHTSYSILKPNSSFECSSENKESELINMSAWAKQEELSFLSSNYHNQNNNSNIDSQQQIIKKQSLLKRQNQEINNSINISGFDHNNITNNNDQEHEMDNQDNYLLSKRKRSKKNKLQIDDEDDEEEMFFKGMIRKKRIVVYNNEDDEEQNSQTNVNQTNQNKSNGSVLGNRKHSTKKKPQDDVQIIGYIPKLIDRIPNPYNLKPNVNNQDDSHNRTMDSSSPLNISIELTDHGLNVGKFLHRVPDKVSRKLYGSFKKDQPDCIVNHKLNYDKLKNSKDIAAQSAPDVTNFLYKLTWKNRPSGFKPLPNYYYFDELKAAAPKLLLNYLEQLTYLKH